MNSVYGSDLKGFAPMVDSMRLQFPIFEGKPHDLEEAILNGDRAKVEEYFKSNLDPNIVGRNGITPLLLAISGDNSGIVKLLLEKGANPNVKDDRGVSALWFSATKTEPSSLQLLLKAGADVNSPNVERRETAIFGAIRSHSLQNVETIVGAGADVNIPNGVGNTPAMFAVELGEFEIAYDLVMSGADVRKRNTFGVDLLGMTRHRKIGNQERAIFWRTKLIGLLESK